MTNHVTLTEFLLARIAEDEVDWRAVDTAPVDAQLHGRRLAPRMLAECEAKRRIVELQAENDEDRHRPGFHYKAQMIERILRALGFPYADHPDYREEWAL